MLNIRDDSIKLSPVDFSEWSAQAIFEVISTKHFYCLSLILLSCQHIPPSACHCLSRDEAISTKKFLPFQLDNMFPNSALHFQKLLPHCEIRKIFRRLFEHDKTAIHFVYMNNPALRPKRIIRRCQSV